MKNSERINIGRDGETRATDYLVNHGYLILDRNFRVRDGEIDIIALKNNILTFVEVKTLPNGTIETLSHELNQRKQQKIIKTAKLYIQKHRQYNNKYISFDVLALDVPGLEPIYHIVQAFSE